MHKGDKYVVYPFNTPERASIQTSGTSVMVSVETVRCLTSDLVGVDETASAVKQIMTAWKAKPVAHLSPRKTSVRLMGSASSRLLPTGAKRQQHFLHLCTEDEDTEPCIFHVAVKEHKEYEILDGSLERIDSLPTTPLDISEASECMMDVLQHIAIFKFFEGVENRTPSASFEDSFSILPVNGAGASSVFDVRHGEKWGFKVENLGGRPLYLAIFDFKPSWQITNLVSQAGGGDYMIVQPRGEDGAGKEEIWLKMHVPESLKSRSDKRCEDIVKIFITSKPTSFPSMVLPELSLHAETLTRTAPGSDSQLLKFLSELATPFRDQDHAQEEWATQNFIICTIAE